MVLITSVSMASLSFRILNDPQNEMEPGDAGRQFGSYVHVPWGVPEAIDLLVSEAEKGRVVDVFTGWSREVKRNLEELRDSAESSR